MRSLVQRVSTAQVVVEGTTIGDIGAGLLIFVCGMPEDTTATAAKMAAKLSKLRIFKDADGRMNRSILDTGGSALVVSQFTLAGDTSRGNRPGFSGAAPPDLGEALYEAVVRELLQLGVPVSTGQFGADMQVALVNDGPVTLWVEVD